jgi:hypothetical protein
MKEWLKNEYTSRLRMILKCEFNAKNTITAIGALAVPILKQFWYHYPEMRRNKKNWQKNWKDTSIV